MTRGICIFVLFASVTLTSSAAGAASIYKCDQKKINAAGKHVACLLKLHAKEAAKGKPLLSGKCFDKLAASFEKVDASGGCNDAGNLPPIALQVDAMVDLVDTVLGGNPPSELSACTGAKTKAAGQKASCLLKEIAKAEGKAIAPNASELAKCETKFVDAFVRAESRNDCLGPLGDAVEIEAIIDTFVGDVGRALNRACYDQRRNGEETATDCGGPACEPCSIGSTCAVNADCSSDYCADEYCQSPPSCYNGVVDGLETGLDCGGDCVACPTGETCELGSECESDVCSGNVCAEPACSDGEENGNETDVDCGGPDCPPCAAGDACMDDLDCTSGDCGEYDLCDEPAPPEPGPESCDCETCEMLQTNGGDLPSPKGCTMDGQPACNGWTPAGTLENTDDITMSKLNRGALFYKNFMTDWGEFRCLYFPRYNEPMPPDNLLHGMLCFSTSGCEACAYDLDKNGDPNDSIKFPDIELQKKGKKGAKCAGCHGPGTLLPKSDLWKDARDDLAGINERCSKNGGPNWLCFPEDPDWPAPNTDDIVKASDVSNELDAECGDCHEEGFIRKRGTDLYCDVIRAAFLKGGSMQKKKVKFPSKADCESWMNKMMCATDEFCDKPEVAEQP